MGRRWALRTLNFIKSAMNVVLFTIIVVITSNLIQKIALNMLFAAARFNRFFLLAFHGKAFVYQNFEFKEVSYGSVILNNHCGDNLEPNSKDISEYAVLCPLL